MSSVPCRGECLRTGASEIDLGETEIVPSHIESVRPADPSNEQFLRAIEVSGSFDFWDDPGEDIYSIHDGEPL